ncbi:hypothetical protein HMPREF1350_02472, partial [Enterococcus faecium 509]
IPRNWLLNTVYSKQEVVTRLLSRPLVLLSKYWFSATMFEYAFSIY